MSEALTIGKIARAAGVGVETIRFYEREGLIAIPARPRAGYRKYPAETIRRVRFIRRAKEPGFTLKEISELLSLRVAAGSSCADVRALAASKMRDIDRKIAELERVKSALDRVASTCRGRGPTSACPILDFLDEELSDAKG